MVIQIDNKSILCNSFEEYEEQIYKIFKMASAEIWISENGETAIKGILDYFDSKRMSDHLQWEEL